MYDSNNDNRRRMPQSAQQPVRGATAPDLSKIQDSTISQQQYSRRQPGNSQQSQQKPETLYTPSQSLESHTSDGVQNQGQASLYPPGFNESEDADNRRPPQQQRQQANVLQKNNRKFGDAYEGQGQGNGGSSGGARRVMDWFRKRGKERSG